MKLFYCIKCQDIVRPYPGKTRSCECGNLTVTPHPDNITVEYSGDNVIPIGFNNSSFLLAAKNQPEDGWGKSFEAFIIPKQTKTIIKT